MENATKALLISAVVLFAIIVLTIGMYLYGTLGDVTEKYVDELDEVELLKYNSSFSIYANRTDITAQEIVTVANLARQTELGTQVFVDKENITSKTEEKFKDWENTFLKENILTDIKNAEGEIQTTNTYMCKTISYDDYGKINEIRFDKN